MNFQLKTGDKFHCVAFENLAIDSSLSKPLHLGEELWTLPKHPFSLDKHWREWIGRIKAEKVDRCNFFLIAVKNSTRPDVLDDENKMLHRRLNRLLYGLLLQGIPDHVDGFVLSGAKPYEESQIRQYGEMKEYYNSNPKKRVKLSEAVCRKAKLFEQGYSHIEDSSVYSRVKRGMSAVSRGISDPTLQERIHEYVRALEAVAKTEIGKSASQFTHRCQTFALASNETRKILDEGYKIRSAVEHMNLVDDVFPGCSVAEIELRAGKLLRQIEALVLSVYLQIATSRAHAQIFETDASIDEYWSRRDDERRFIWGASVDISTVQ